MSITLEQLDIKEEYETEIDSHGFIIETVSEPINSDQTKSIAIWSNDETIKLIELYKQFMNEIGPYNRFRRKKDMWLEISNRIPNKSAKQAEERLKTILRRKRKGLVELSAAKRKLLDMQKEANELEDHIRKEKVDLEADESVTPSKGNQVWSASETKLLVGLYKSFVYEVGPQKRFTHKKDMWLQIAANMESKDAQQCEQRFYTIFKRKKKCLTKSSVNKTRRKTVDFRPRNVELAETSLLKSNRVIELEDDIVNLPLPEKKVIKEKINTRPGNAAAADNIEPLTISETLKEIATTKEEGKERRHRERMEAVAKFQTILLQMLNTRNK